MRGPVPAGSLADLVFVTAVPTSVQAVNDVFRQAFRSDRYRHILGVTDETIVSSNII